MRVTGTHVYFWRGILSQWASTPFVDEKVKIYSAKLLPR
jgi:hypothetical protein